MLIDFGEEILSKTVHIHVSCLLLRYSRFYTSMLRIKKELVIDQDAVFVASETYGEVIKIRTFEDFCTEQDILSPLFCPRKESLHQRFDCNLSPFSIIWFQDWIADCSDNKWLRSASVSHI